MGFSRRIINSRKTIEYLFDNDLKSLYSSDSIIFDDEFSSFVNHLYSMNKSETEIINLLKKNMEEKNNEVY